MDDRLATLVAESWNGGGGLVSRGPRWLLGWCQTTRAEAERRTGRHLRRDADVWRVQIGGRFLQSEGPVFPGGVPFPSALTGTMATVSSEVWVYVDTSGPDLVGEYWWPEAVRRPIASRPEPDFLEADIVSPQDAAGRLDVRIARPHHRGWEVPLVVCVSRDEAVVICAAGTVPDPLNEMLVFDCGGLSMRIQPAAHGPVPTELVSACCPPYRAVSLPGSEGAGREPGRALGPQTWPWPGELMWIRDGQRYVLKGFAPLATLSAVAATVR